jgi:hypothetical protein
LVAVVAVAVEPMVFFVRRAIAVPCLSVQRSVLVIAAGQNALNNHNAIGVVMVYLFRNAHNAQCHHFFRAQTQGQVVCSHDQPKDFWV